MSTRPVGRPSQSKRAARDSAPAPPNKPRRRNPRLTEERADAFIEHLARTGSVTVAAEQAGIGRTQIYEHRRTHKRFAAAWTKALGLGVERLHDNAITRALEGDERPIVRKGEVIGTERRIDNRLVQFLLKVHKPEFAGGAPTASVSEQEAMARRLKAAARRLDAHRARQEVKKGEES
jgi:hypothetical protein